MKKTPQLYVSETLTLTKGPLNYEKSTKFLEKVEFRMIRTCSIIQEHSFPCFILIPNILQSRTPS